MGGTTIPPGHNHKWHDPGGVAHRGSFSCATIHECSTPDFSSVEPTTPSGSRPLRAFFRGYRRSADASLLNPRLLSGNPSGCVVMHAKQVRGGTAPRAALCEAVPEYTPALARPQIFLAWLSAPPITSSPGLPA